ncbi:MAG: hemolysin XhlA family protein [Clostridiales bacterium]|jgi:hypothetical protein|nr:hemolysin XhlA family protein [Clostridiales bacterium]
MNEAVCDERHKRVNERLDNHESRLNNHSMRLDKLEQNSVGLQKDLKHLCENLKALTSTMWWFIGILITSFIGFFFYAVQRGLFK